MSTDHTMTIDPQTPAATKEGRELGEEMTILDVEARIVVECALALGKDEEWLYGSAGDSSKGVRARINIHGRHWDCHCEHLNALSPHIARAHRLPLPA